MPTGIERRQADRIPARVEVHFRHGADAAKAFRAYSLNFSVGGLCIRTQRNYENGAVLQLALEVDGHHYDLEGVVAWIRGGFIGVRFQNVSPEDRSRLAKLTEALRAQAS